MHTFVNNVKTALLMGGLIGLMAAVGAAMGPGYIVPMLVVGLVMNIGAWFFSDTIAIKAMRGRELEDREVHGDDEATEEDAEKDHHQRLKKCGQSGHRRVHFFFVEVRNLLEH